MHAKQSPRDHSRTPRAAPVVVDDDEDRAVPVPIDDGEEQAGPQATDIDIGAGAGPVASVRSLESLSVRHIATVTQRVLSLDSHKVADRCLESTCAALQRVLRSHPTLAVVITSYAVLEPTKNSVRRNLAQIIAGRGIGPVGVPRRSCHLSFIFTSQKVGRGGKGERLALLARYSGATVHHVDDQLPLCATYRLSPAVRATT